ncbi:MAG: SMC-Scp complex subunit ScpB [Planctomycetes bacterium]|nr:SMC-Scp complex subunit ScpB [Planctomycetota bacterium]
MHAPSAGSLGPEGTVPSCAEDLCSGEVPDPTDESDAEGTTSDEASEEPARLEGTRLRQVVEALLFAASEPITLRRFRRMLPEADRAELEQALLGLEGALATEGRGYGLVEEGGGYRLLTRPDLAPYVARLRGERKRIRLSKAAFESLAIIAYRQPIRRSDLDSIRGVQSGNIIKNLMEWNLIGVVGRDDAIGRSLLYGTTEEFLDQFGLSTLSDLPNPSAFLELGTTSGLEVGGDVELDSSTDEPVDDGDEEGDEEGVVIDPRDGVTSSPATSPRDGRPDSEDRASAVSDEDESVVEEE